MYVSTSTSLHLLSPLAEAFDRLSAAGSNSPDEIFESLCVAQSVKFASPKARAIAWAFIVKKERTGLRRIRLKKAAKPANEGEYNASAQGDINRPA